MVNHWEKALYKNKRESIEDHYLCDKKKLETTKRMIKYIQDNLALTSSSKVIEFGCNLGRNLRELYKIYGCDIYGIDINEECIEKNKKFFNKKDNFYKEDLRRLDFFKTLKNDSFDLGITMGFLMHIEPNNNKKQLVTEIMRVCKFVCFFELYSNKTKTVFNKDEWLVSFEDYRNYNKDIVLTSVVGRQNPNLRLFFKRANK